MNKNITLIQGDITQQSTDAIVNAANSSLAGGGGVDGAIHRAAGPEILLQCKQIIAQIGRLQTGRAVITSAGNLNTNFIIHTVGPIFKDGSHNEDVLLADAYRNSLQLAVDNNIKTIAFPSISTGAYRFPIDRAAPIAIRTVDNFLNKHPLDEVRFVLFNTRDLMQYQKAWQLLNNPHQP